MTKEHIIKLAREAGLAYGSDERPLGSVTRFAALVAAVEREACAQIAKDWDASHPHTNYGACISNAIRARGDNGTQG